MNRRKRPSVKTYYESRFRPRGSGWTVYTKELGWLSMKSLSSATPVRFKTAKAADWRARYDCRFGAGEVRVIEHRERVVNVN